MGFQNDPAENKKYLLAYLKKKKKSCYVQGQILKNKEEKPLSADADGLNNTGQDAQTDG